MVDAIIADTSADDNPAVNEIVTRAEAKARGLKRFFDGVACPKGHVVERCTSNGSCIECQLDRARAWRKANPDKTKAYDKVYRETNAEKVKARDRAAAKAWREANPGKMRAYYKAWQKANPDKVSFITKKWKKANPDKVRASSRARYKANRDKELARSKKWAKDNPDKAREIVTIRRARKRNQLGVVTRGIRAKLRRLQKGKCANCFVSLKKAGEHEDHIRPLAKGGRHEDTNLQLLCPSCNQRKNAKDPLVFAREEGRLL